MAFHLGCLRALYDRDLLSQAEVISTVSGGAVIGAMYAYSDDPFEEFERRVRATLRRGFARGIARRSRAGRARAPQGLREAVMLRNRPALLDIVARAQMDAGPDEAYFLAQLRAAVIAVETPAERFFARYLGWLSGPARAYGRYRD